MTAQSVVLADWKSSCDGFQPYCGNTIMNNLGDLQDMVKAVEAVLHQSWSTNEAPDHKYWLSSCHFLITSSERPEYVRSVQKYLTWSIHHKWQKHQKLLTSQTTSPHSHINER